jgi:transmembrane sensor
MELSNFDRLLDRYLHNKATEQERAKINLWLDVRGKRHEEDAELTKEEQEILFQKITSPLANEKEIIDFRPSSAIEDSRRTWTFRIAASIIFVTLSGILAWYLIGTGPGTLQYSNAHKVDKMILNDGTIVWLRGTGSSLSYIEMPQRSERHGQLRGEALFEVAKNPSMPFILSCDKYIIKVIGTSFSLKTVGDGLQVKVFTGKVNISTPTDQVGIDIEPNETVIYSGDEVTSRQTMSAADIQSTVADTEFDMSFTNTKMSSVIEKISAKFDVKMLFIENSIANCKITADFTDRSLESTLQMLSDVLDVSFAKKGDQIEINGAGCK